jgi:hypothetical protein
MDRIIYLFPSTFVVSSAKWEIRFKIKLMSMIIFKICNVLAWGWLLRHPSGL